MTSRSRRLNRDLAGTDLGRRAFEVTAEGIEAYARAVEDLNPRYLAGGDSVAGPVWPVVPAFESFMAAARHPDLGADLRRLLHASEEHLLVASIRPGDMLTVHSLLDSIDDHPAGETFTIRATLAVAPGVSEDPPSRMVVAEVAGTMLIRGPGTGGSLEPDREPGQILYEDSVFVAEDQMRRYADASGDHNPIHLDRAAARRAGLRSPILHGMCTMAMAARGVVNGVADGDPSRVRRIGVRFARPVVPGRTLTTRVWELEDRGDGTQVAFVTVDDLGASVIEGGRAEISR